LYSKLFDFFELVGYFRRAALGATALDGYSSSNAYVILLEKYNLSQASGISFCHFEAFL
jgi:hypothetical protein